MNAIENITKKELNALLAASTETYYSLPVLSIGGKSYAVARSEKQANAAYREWVKGHVWDLNEDWLMEASGLDEDEFDELNELASYEETNNAICAAIEKNHGLEKFIDKYMEGACIEIDRRDLSHEETELELAGGFLAYPVCMDD